MSVAWKQHWENSRDNRRGLVSSYQQLWAWSWIQSMSDFVEFFRGLIVFQWAYWEFFLESFLGFWLWCVQPIRDFTAVNNSYPESVFCFLILRCCQRFWIYLWNLATRNPKDPFICHFDRKSTNCESLSLFKTLPRMSPAGDFDFLVSLFHFSNGEWMMIIHNKKERPF